MSPNIDPTESTDSLEAKKPARSAAQIEADLENARIEIARDIDALTSRLDPRTQLENAKEVATEQLAAAQTQAQAFVADLKAGDQQAVKKAAMIASGAVGFIALIVLARRKK